MKTYRVPRWYIFYRYFLLTLWTVIIIPPVGLIVVTAGPEVSLGMRLFFTALLFFTPFAWYMQLRDFHTIVLQDNGLITFRSPTRKATFALGDITSIVLRVFQQDIIIIHDRRDGDLIYYEGVAFPMTRIGGRDDFLRTVKSLNPEIEVDRAWYLNLLVKLFKRTSKG
ncbi:MAG TPA: hypothetical protein VE439_03720 [Anaerolineae bacterium]|nr:hypothetical protein [Anaerolineae bacterium]